MLKKSKMAYEEVMDPECIELCNILNSLPGIETIESCCGHAKTPYRIWFKCNNDIGLFILTRSKDSRYWKYGHLWDINLSTGDIFENNRLPLYYYLGSKLTGGEAYMQANDLVENIKYNLNDKNFLEYYRIKL